MGRALDKISIAGFKSIKELNDFELGNLNILIGGNGAGKSNFIEIFRMLRAMIGSNLSRYVLARGGADDLLYNGPKTTKHIKAKFEFGTDKYSFVLEPTVNDEFTIRETREKYDVGLWEDTGNGKLKRTNTFIEKDSDWKPEYKITKVIYDSVTNLVVYHFHDTSDTAPMRRYEIIEDNKYLRPDASNIAPYLYKIKTQHKKTYQEIIDSIRMVTPFFDDFILEPIQKGAKEKINLSWLQKGSDYPMQPYHFSDGTIRFICLVTALIQPDYPSTIIIDEPELGLHPGAISILAELIEVASQRTQVIVSTQSPGLIDQFSIEDIVVVNRVDEASTFKRLKEDDFSVWLENYSVGELWTKNVITGGPVYE